MLEKLSWHSQNWQYIERARSNGRAPHAYLLWGQRGIGKQYFAKQMAKDLFCLDDDSACGHCQGCQWFEKDIHPDFILLEPLKGKKKITVEQIRDLQTDLALTNQQKTPRVILINNAELMNLAASNALLKSLEEPINQCVYILVSHSLLTIPATIQSRCQTLYFAPASHQEVEDYLAVNQLDTKQASLLHGSPLLTETLLSESAFTARMNVIDSLRALLAGEKSPCFTVSQWVKQEALFVLRVLFEWFSDLVKLRCDGDKKQLTHQQQLNDLQQMACLVHKQQLFTILDKIVMITKHEITARQINTALWLDDLAIEIIR